MREPDGYDSKIIEMYTLQRKPMRRISQELHISVGKVYNRLKSNGIESRSHTDYPITEKQREAGRRASEARKGTTLRKETKERISAAKFKGGVGHKKKRTDGYIEVYFPEHPGATKDGYVMEHDLVMECVIGRRLRPDEIVHHINHQRDDNRVANLRLMTKSEHMSLHTKERWEKGKLNNNRFKKKVINITTGEQFSSTKEAAAKYGIAGTNIAKACRKSSTSCGCKWEYERSDDLSIQ